MKDIELTEKLRSKFVEFELDVDFSDKGLDNLAEACASIAQSYAEDKVKEVTANKEDALRKLIKHVFMEAQKGGGYTKETEDHFLKWQANQNSIIIEDKVKELTLKNAEIHGGYIHELDSLRVDNSKLNDKVKEAKELLGHVLQLIEEGVRPMWTITEIKTFLGSGNIKK